MPEKNNLNKLSRIAGFLYLAMTITSIFGLIAPPSKTIGELSFIASQIIFILLVLVLYKLFENVDKTMAKLMVTFVFIGVPVAIFSQNVIYYAQIFWGLWLFPLGVLVYKSKFFPKFIGILLFIAGFGYLVDVVGFFFFPNLNLKISQFTFIGELLIMIWLLKGINIREMKNGK